MKNILTITNLTVREAFSRKIFVTFAAVSAVTLILFVVFFIAVDTDQMISVVKEKQSSKDFIADLVRFFRVLIIIPLFGGGLFLSIFSSSSFVPQMLEQGSIELLLSKPVSRAQIILGKFAGGIYVVFINLSFLIVGLWFLLGIKFGIWDWQFLTTIFTTTFAFATLYAMIILLGLLTRSSILAMMISYLVFFILSPLLSARGNIYILIDSKVAQFFIDTLYYILPQTSELGTITTDLAAGSSLIDYNPIIFSLLFMILNIILSIFIFSKKDY